MSEKITTGSRIVGMLDTKLLEAHEIESINTAELAEIISMCFDLSMTVGLDEQLRADCLVAGKRLRGILVNLLSARFESSSQEFQEASANLTRINKQLIKVFEGLEKVAKLVEDIGGLISQLDGLLKLAVAFV